MKEKSRFLQGQKIDPKVFRSDRISLILLIVLALIVSTCGH